MTELHIRVSDELKNKLVASAKDNKLTLNKYINKVLENTALSPEIKSLDEKYQMLFSDVIALYKAVIDEQFKVISENTKMMKEILNERN